jgi:hypothetical protein
MVMSSSGGVNEAMDEVCSLPFSKIDKTLYAFSFISIFKIIKNYLMHILSHFPGNFQKMSSDVL